VSSAEYIKDVNSVRVSGPGLGLTCAHIWPPLSRTPSSSLTDSPRCVSPSLAGIERELTLWGTVLELAPPRVAYLLGHRAQELDHGAFSVRSVVCPSQETVL
jgi:hypothetical protein